MQSDGLTFYRYQHLYEEGGEEALVDISKRKPLLKNRVDPIQTSAIDLSISDGRIEHTSPGRFSNGGSASRQIAIDATEDT